jgi:hypothetical protein
MGVVLRFGWFCGIERDFKLFRAVIVGWSDVFFLLSVFAGDAGSPHPTVHL